MSRPPLHVTETVEQQAAPKLSTQSADRSRTKSPRLELVTETGTDGVDAGIDRRREAEIFPFRAHEQSADQIDVDAEARGIAVDQMIVLGIETGEKRLPSGRRAPRCRGPDVERADGPRDVGIAER